MKKTTATEKEPGSFRDPSGFLFYQDGKIYRQINAAYKDHYDHFLNCGLYEQLVRDRLLIPHEEISSVAAFSSDAYKIIRPERIPFISYPYEWCFSQLKDAGLLTLRIQKLALRHGMTLKDASAYNIQFRGSHPVFIDTLSFEKYQEGEPWNAYRQFCQHFLAPLALMVLNDIRTHQLLRIYLDGCPLDLASRLLPARSRLNLSLLIHIHWHARSQKRFSQKAIHNEKFRFGRLAFLGLLDSLENALRKLNWQSSDTEWALYYEATNYSAESALQKKEQILTYLSRLKPALVFDLGANTGLFSRIASAQGIATIAFDVDPAAVECNYLECKKTEDRLLLPLLMDLTNPSPAQGWAHRERLSFQNRAPADVIMALALVHHLAISNNLPLGTIADFLSKLGRFLIIEFVPKTDSQVQRLFQSRKDIFPDYTQKCFEKAFDPYFSLEKPSTIAGSERTLYLMKSRLFPAPALS